MERKKTTGFYATFRKYILKNPKAIVGLSIIFIFAVVAIFAGVITPYNPRSIEFMPWEKPNGTNLLGTNSYGQDIFTQTIYGARTTLLVGILAGLLASLIGTAIGLIAGYKGGTVSEALMRIVDVFLTIPSLALNIVIASLLPRMSIGYTILVIGVLNWMWMARSVRSQTLSESRRDYVDAAKALGMGDWEIMFKEIVPNIIPVITANMVMVINNAMLSDHCLIKADLTKL